MSMNELRKKVGGAALTLVMVFGIAIMSSATAQAQWRDNDRYNGNQEQVRWTSERNRQYSFMLGYHNAYTEGKNAAERGYRGSPRDMAGYRNSNNGYRAWMGSESTYRDSYRKGYEQGFSDGQTGRSRRYDRDDIERVLGGDLERVYEREDRHYPDDRDRDRRGDYNDRDGRNRSELYRVAQQNGYNDGLRHGRDDVNRRRSYNLDDSSDYRNATRGYRSEFGNRETYRNAYRDGFRQGYEDGYRRRNGRDTNNRFPWPF